MRNVKLSVVGNKLTIEVDLEPRLGPSASKKSIVIGSTDGNVSVPGHEDVKLGLNVYQAIQK